MGFAAAVLLAACCGVIEQANAFNNATGRWDTLSCTNATSGHCGGFKMAALAKVNKGAGGEPAAFIVARNDKLIVEWYTNQATSRRLFGVASMTKGTIGVMKYGLRYQPVRDQCQAGRHRCRTLPERVRQRQRPVPVHSHRIPWSRTTHIDDAEECADEFNTKCVTPHSALPKTDWEYKLWYADGQKDGYHQALSDTPLTCQARTMIQRPTRLRTGETHRGAPRAVQFCDLGRP